MISDLHGAAHRGAGAGKGAPGNVGDTSDVDADAGRAIRSIRSPAWVAFGVRLSFLSFDNLDCQSIATALPLSPTSKNLA